MIKKKWIHNTYEFDVVLFYDNSHKFLKIEKKKTLQKDLFQWNFKMRTY